MSQARHAMGGPLMVSSLQYDARMKALVSIESSVNSGVSFNELTKLPDKKLVIEFQVDRKIPSNPIKKVASVIKQSSDSQVRRRKFNVDKGSVEDVPLSKEPCETVTMDDDDETYELIDPIKWFGVLVPPYLRRSQDHFKQCEAIVTIRNITLRGS